MTANAAEHWDVVVVGSGLGGLSCAASLGALGYRVLVLERHDLAGGNATVFRRNRKGHEYEFDVGVHYIGEANEGGLFPQIFSSLGVGDRINFRPLDPDGFDTVLLPGIEFHVPADWDTYIERLIATFPTEEHEITHCMQILRDVAKETRERYIPGVETPTFDKWAYRNLSELFAHTGLSEQAQALIDHWSGLYGSQPSRSSIAMHALIIHHYMSGAYYPEGGGQVMPARLIQVIEAHGGEVRTLTGVREITIDATSDTPRTTGVITENGDVITADIVVSNADHRRTVCELVGRDHWKPSTVEFADNAEMTLGLIVAYVVVDVDLTKDRPNTNYHIYGSFDIESTYAALDTGELPDDDWAYIALASNKDPNNKYLCPPGYTNFQIMTLAPRGASFWGIDVTPGDGGKYRRDATYRSQKEQISDRLLNAAERVFGPIRDHIVFMELATPMTHERYTHSSGGTSYGYIHSPEQSGPRRPSHSTEIDGLYLTGANTVSGHGIAGSLTGGVNCAGSIVGRHLLIEMLLGERLVDPDMIPADPEDFDPMHFSRGERLRSRRKLQRV